MIDLVDLKKAITNLLKDTEIRVLDVSAKEGILRPCFSVQLLPIVGSELIKPNTYENSYMVEINYFSKEKTQLENLKMADTLRKKVMPFFNIKNRKLTPSNVRNEIVDGVLSFKFNLKWLDAMARKEYEKVKELEIEMRG